MDITLDQWLAEQPADVVMAAEQRALELIEEIGVSFVREAMGKTQADLAQLLGSSQAYISKLERQTDMMLSTLKSYVHAAGGNLEIKVVFPGGEMSAASLGGLTNGHGTAVYPMPRSGSELLCYSGGEITSYTVHRFEDSTGLRAFARRTVSAPIPTYYEAPIDERIAYAAEF